MERLAEFIGGVSPEVLYGLLALIAFIEALFPPVPADVVVALASFLAARRGMNLYLTITMIVGGMTAGSALVYWVARKYGAVWMHAQLKRFGIDTAERKLEAMYGRYGLGALFVGRFIPGLRMLVPAVAGMLRVPFAMSVIILAFASLIWYGLIAALAYRVGSDWEMFRFAVERLIGRVGLTAAAFLVLSSLVGWAVWRRRKFKVASKKAGPPEASIDRP